MKKWFNLGALLLMVSGSLVFTSCKDDDDDNEPESPLVGVWAYESVDISITINEVDFIDYIIEAFDLTQAEAEEFEEEFIEEMNEFDGMKWTFTKDSKFTVTSPEGNENGTWSLSADNKKLSLTSGTETDVITVKSLTSSKMELFYAEEYEEDMDEDGEDDVFAISMTLKLKK